MTWSSNGNAERKLKARLRAEGRACHICGQPIDYSLPPGTPWSFEADHVVPRARGGAVLDYSNLDAAHRMQPEEGQAHAGRREARRDKAHEAVLKT